MEKNYTVDLHIHSFNSLKRKEGDKGKIPNLSLEEFISSVKKIEPEVISITDHNIFDLDLYNELSKLEDKIVFPGVELDFHIENSKAFHALVICNPDLVSEFNDIMSSEKTGMTIDGKSINETYDKSISFSTFIHKTQDMKDDLIIIPHFHSKDKNVNGAIKSLFGEVDPESKLPKDFKIDWLVRFNFDALEISKSKSIEKSNQLLIDGNINSSVVSFSDCHDITKYPDLGERVSSGLTSVLFDGTFRDLKYAFSDPLQRIFHKKLQKKNKITKITFDDKEIQLSSYLNVIIGPRGSGKSMLIEKIKSSLEKSQIDRKYFGINHEHISVNTNSIPREQVLILKQGELSSDHVLTNEGLEALLKKHQLFIKDKKSSSDLDLTKHNLAFSKISYILKQERKQFEEEYNFNNFKETIAYVTDDEEKKNIAEFAKGINSEVTIIKKELENLVNIKREVNKSNRETILNLASELRDFEESKVISFNDSATSFLNYIDKYEENVKLKSIWTSKISTYFSVDDETSHIENKVSMISDFKKSIRRELLINKMIKDAGKFQEEIELANELIKFDINNQFTYVEGNGKEIIVRNEYIKLIENDYSFETNIYDARDKTLYEALNKFKSKRKLNKGKGENENKLIFNFNLYEVKNEVMALWKDKLKKLSEMSPGQKGKVIVSFILDKLTSKYTTIIIDQPEDNLDPGTINETLVSRIRYEKWRRQFIIVTHSPLMVFNADANKVIVPDINSKDNKLIITDYGSPFKVGVKEKILETLEGSEESLQHRMDRNKHSYNNNKGYKGREYDNRIWE